MSAPEQPTPLSIWKRLTTAERRAIKLMRNGNFLYRRTGRFRAIGSTSWVKLATVRKLRTLRLVHDAVNRSDRPLMLTPLGVQVLDAGENRTGQARLERERKQVTTASLRDYTQAHQGCTSCTDGYTSNCPTPDQCAAPAKGCARCIIRCANCYDDEGVNA